jgi:hypothetical protein
MGSWSCETQRQDFLISFTRNSPRTPQISHILPAVHCRPGPQLSPLVQTKARWHQSQNILWSPHIITSLPFARPSAVTVPQCTPYVSSATGHSKVVCVCITVALEFSVNSMIDCVFNDSIFFLKIFLYLHSFPQPNGFPGRFYVTRQDSLDEWSARHKASACIGKHNTERPRKNIHAVSGIWTRDPV